LAQNKLVLAKVEKDKKQIIDSTILPKALLLLFKSLLVGVAFIKILLYMDLLSVGFNELMENSQILPVIILYLLVAIAHIYTSTYFVAYCILYIRIKLSESKELDNIKIHKTIIIDNTDISFEESKISSGENYHFITKKVIENNKLIDDDNTETSKYFKLHTWGLLTDKQLDELIWSQRNEAPKRELALVGLRHQLNLLGVSI
jgi:hypothetical protein